MRFHVRSAQKKHSWGKTPCTRLNVCQYYETKVWNLYHCQTSLSAMHLKCHYILHILQKCSNIHMETHMYHCKMNINRWEHYVQAQVQFVPMLHKKECDD